MLKLDKANMCILLPYDGLLKPSQNINFISFHLKYAVKDNMVLQKYRLLAMYMLQGCIREYSNECIKPRTQ
jgi:hypothetical protein